MRRESPRTTDFGILLTQLRKRQNYTLAQLGSHAGVTPGYISLLETDGRKPTETVIRKLCGPLDVQPTVLLVSARIHTFDFASTLRPEMEHSDQETQEYTLSLTESERIQVQLFIDFLKYKTTFDSVRSSG